jgi:hypothetical protein
MRRESSTTWRPRLIFCAVAAALLMITPAALASPMPPFEPIAIQRIDLPLQIKDASTPVFTSDGRHLLFFSSLHLWIVGTNGNGLDCLSCGLANEPTLPQTEQEGFATEFPDGRRVFFGAAGSIAVLECSPSVLDCASRRILPIDLSAARPDGGLVTPGATNPGPAGDVGGGSSPKLAPDGVHIAFSDVRSDAAELMVIATLQREADKYVVTDPRVINPPGPTSLTDPDPRAWSDSTALYEFKTFADGGADATYVEVGGPATLNPDVWEVNLATGRRTRLTANPDWDEDDAPSPDGRSLVVESDRGMHRTDMLGGLLPVRGFIDAPQVSIYASYYVAGPVDRQCDLQPWLLPAGGDDNAKLMGQPIQPYAGGDVHAANNVSGWPQWSSDGTEIALNTESYETNLSAPYLLIAHRTAAKATAPLRVVSSQPGSWAPSPEGYHGAIESEQPVVLHGLSSGTATVVYSGLGVISGDDSVVFDNYSDNGRDFVNGTSMITNPDILTGPIHIATDLTMTGSDTGYSHIDLTLSGTDTTPVTATGTAVTSYDGTTISGPPHTPAPCPRALPRAPRMKLTARLERRARKHVIRAHVTAAVAGAGANEGGVDIRPVVDARITVDRASGHTDRNGDAVLAIPANPGGPATVAVHAGDTLAPASTRIDLPAAGRAPRCPRATGWLDGVHLGPIRLGQSLAQLRRRLPRISTRRHADLEFLCLTPNGIRIGLPSQRLLREITPRQRRRVRSRVVFASTANVHYALNGVRAGARLTHVARRLRIGRRFRIGINTWYLVPGRASHGVLKVRHGIIEEIGIVDRRLTTGSRATGRFLQSFG